MKKLYKGILVATAAMLMTSAAYGQTATDSFDVRASVASQCRISTAATDIDFGAVDIFIGDTATGTFGVRCVRGTTAGIALDLGQNSVNVTTFGNRAMHWNDGTNDYYLEYNLLQPDNATDWTPTSTLDITGDFSDNSLEETYTINAVLPAGQLDPAVGGGYLDTVQITVSF